MSQKNVGMWDKGIRLFITAVITPTLFSRPERDGLTWLLIISIVYLLITALSGHCFIYEMFKLSTYEGHRK